jgi:hypothetical protein
MNDVAFQRPSAGLSGSQIGTEWCPLVTHVAMLWLFVTLPLLTVKLLSLPHNLILVDLWIAAAMAIFWLSFAAGRQTIMLTPYLIPMWLILVGSVISTFASPSASRSLIVLIKEVYLFAWFLTMTMMLSRLSPRKLRLVMLVWLATVILHGALIIAQFLSPDLWRFVSHLGNQPVAHDQYRPSGLFITPKAGNANKAAFFQLMGFVPLVLTSRSNAISLLLAAILSCSILATGSMGATIALSVGVVVGVTTILVLSQNALLLLRVLTKVAAAAAIVVAVLFSSLDESNQSHLKGIIFNRAEKSSGGRFALWQRGLGVLVRRDGPLIAGVGPENFRVVDGKGNQLHNDLLAFVVERGLIGGVGLVLLGGVALSRSLWLLRMPGTLGERLGVRSIVFLASMVTIAFESLTHQVFHSRELWLVLAAQEAFVNHSRYLHVPSLPPGHSRRKQEAER